MQMGTCSTNCVQFVGHSLRQTHLKGTHSFCWLYTGLPFYRLPLKGFRASKAAPIILGKNRTAKICSCISIWFIPGPTIDDHGSRSTCLLERFFSMFILMSEMETLIATVSTFGGLNLQQQALTAPSVPSAQSSRTARKCPNLTAHEIYSGCRLQACRQKTAIIQKSSTYVINKTVFGPVLLQGLWQRERWRIELDKCPRPHRKNIKHTGEAQTLLDKPHKY